MLQGKRKSEEFSDRWLLGNLNDITADTKVKKAKVRQSACDIRRVDCCLLDSLSAALDGRATCLPACPASPARWYVPQLCYRCKGGLHALQVLWTPILHDTFVAAVEKLGVDKAVPSRILEEMGAAAASLTRQNIASHLQMYRQRWCTSLFVYKPHSRPVAADVQTIIVCSGPNRIVQSDQMTPDSSARLQALTLLTLPALQEPRRLSSRLWRPEQPHSGATPWIRRWHIWLTAAADAATAAARRTDAGGHAGRCALLATARWPDDSLLHARKLLRLAAGCCAAPRAGVHPRYIDRTRPAACGILDA